MRRSASRTMRRKPSIRQPQNLASISRNRGRRKWSADDKCLCRREIRKQRTVLMVHGCCNQRAVLAFVQTGAQVILSHVVGADVAAQKGRFSGIVNRGGA